MREREGGERGEWEETKIEVETRRKIIDYGISIFSFNLSFKS